MAIFGLKGEPLARARILLLVLPAFLLYGYNQTNIGGVLDYPSFNRHFPEIDTTNTTGSVKAQNAKVQGTIVAIYNIGALIGALGIAPFGRALGRRKGLILATTVQAIGQILQASAFSLAQLIVGRIITGVGVGAMNAIVPVWQSEVTKPKSRGKNVVVVGIFITGGITLAGWVNVGLSHIEELEVAWRLPLALPLLFSIMIVTFTFAFPESPRWLISAGRTEDARAAMLELNDPDQASPVAIDSEIAILQSLVQNDAQNGERGFMDFFKKEPTRLFYRLSLTIIINFCGQMTGANVISYYGKTIFKESLHMKASEAALLNAGVLTWKIVAATFAFLTVDRFGRKPLFMAACGGMGCSMLALTISVWAIDELGSFGASISATFFLFFYMAFFPLGFVGANFLYGAEIAPQDLRMHLGSVGTATHWLFNFVIAEITPVAFATITWRYYIVYTVIGLFSVPLIYFLFPETKGFSLETMNSLFSEPSSFIKVPAYSRALRRESKNINVNDDGKGAVSVTSEVEEASEKQQV